MGKHTVIATTLGRYKKNKMKEMKKKEKKTMCHKTIIVD